MYNLLKLAYFYECLGKEALLKVGDIHFQLSVQDTENFSNIFLMYICISLFPLMCFFF